MNTELEILTEQIRKLSKERFDKFGKYWFKQLRQQKKPIHEYSKVSQEQIRIHVRNIENYMMDYRISQKNLSKKIGFSRNVIYNLKKGYCSRRTHEMLCNFNFEKFL